MCMNKLTGRRLPQTRDVVTEEALARVQPAHLGDCERGNVLEGEITMKGIYSETVHSTANKGGMQPFFPFQTVIWQLFIEDASGRKFDSAYFDM